MDTFLALVLSAGGAAFVTAVIRGLQSLSSTKLESESALIKRLNDDAESAREERDEQRARAERAEKYGEMLRSERESALDLASKYRRMLIDRGIDV